MSATAHQPGDLVRGLHWKAMDTRTDLVAEALARESGDYSSEQFIQWFIKEQVEEVSSMGDLLKIVQRAKDNPLLAEEYLAREGFGEDGEDPTAPPAAGGAL